MITDKFLRMRSYPQVKIHDIEIVYFDKDGKVSGYKYYVPTESSARRVTRFCEHNKPSIYYNPITGGISITVLM